MSNENFIDDQQEEEVDEAQEETFEVKKGKKYPERVAFKEKAKIEPPEVPMAQSLNSMEGKTVARVVREDGSTPRRKRAVSLGLSEWIIPPYTKGVIAKYRMIQYLGKDPSTGDIPDPQDASFPGTYLLTDKFEPDPIKRVKTMQNFGRQDIEIGPDGKETRRYTVNRIEFIAGLKTVNIEANFLEYVFMELHPCNKSNKFRPSDVKAEFERIDMKTSKSAAYRMAEMDLAKDAEEAVIAEKGDLILAWAVQFNIPTNGEKPADIKANVRVAARQDPRKFFSFSKNIAPAIKLNIHDGLDNGLIELDNEKKKFVFTETREPIHVYAVGEDPINSLVKAIQKEEDKNKKYEELVAMLNYWE